MDYLHSFSVAHWILIVLSSFIIGLSKAGLKGIEMLNVTIMAIVFGGKASTGVVLPLLCIADIMAVIYYNQHAQWKHFWRLAPWMMAGILIGVFVGTSLNEIVFGRIMAVIIVLTVASMLFMELKKDMLIPSNKFFSGSMGLAAGFATMIGNLAGAFSNVYFLAMRMHKNSFIGTAAWLFLVINYFKLPFQIIFWKNITASTLLADLLLLPAMILGFWAGIRIVARIKDQGYRKLVLILTIAGALVIFFR